MTLKPPKPPSTKVDRLETIINRLQEPDYDWKLRLAQGAYYYEKLATLVQDRTKAADRPFLYQMLPAGIRWLPQNEQSPFQFAYSAYISQRDYETDLVVGDMDKMLRTVTHPFVPNQVAFARREVMLTKIDSRGSEATRRENVAHSGFLTPLLQAARAGATGWSIARRMTSGTCGRLSTFSRLAAAATSW